VTRLVIIADDLTGAGDSAAALAEVATVSVVLDASSSWPAATVLAVDTDSRHIEPAEAAQRVSFVANRAREAGAAVLKKVDSTLRGNVGTEVRAAADALAVDGRRPLIVMAPAFPAVGRTTSAGTVLVHGRRLERGPHRGDIAVLLDAVGLSHRTIERSTTAVLAQAMHAAFTAGLDALIVDVAVDADLDAVVRAAQSVTVPTLMVGSGGIVRPLRDRWPAEGGSGDRTGSGHAAPPAGSTLFVVGSYAPEARAQCDRLVATGVSPAWIGLNSPQDEVVVTVREALANGDALLAPDPDLPVDRDQAPAMARALAAVVGSVKDDVGALVVTGGETARAILGLLAVTRMTIRGEDEPGVVRYELPELAMHLVTKAGAFGDEDTLVRRRTVARTKEHHTMSLPVIAITMGDAAGVGPEVIVRALAAPKVYDRSRPVVVGDANRLRQAIDITGVPLTVAVVESPSQGAYEVGVIDCIDLACIPEGLPFGELSAVAGDAAYRFIARAVELSLAHEVDAICTAPLNKEALHAGGHLYPGHTEMLAELTGTEEVSMLLNAPNLRVIHVTTHIGLIDMVEKINPGLVERTIRRGYETLVKAGIPNPIIAVCGINPHAGEHGLFGRGEEEEKVAPGIEAARASGIDARGPLPADTAFFRAGRGDFDLVVAMYHDQGHGPVKVLGIENGVNITVGLPVIRTSVDHGTAFDIAGKGTADEASMIEALRQAAELAPKNRQTLHA